MSWESVSLKWTGLTQAAVNITSSKISILIYKMNTGISTVKPVHIDYLQQWNGSLLDG